MFTKFTAMLCTAAAAVGLSLATTQAAPTWTALLDQSLPQVYVPGSSYSLRSIAVSPDGSIVYASWLHTGSGKKIVGFDTGTGDLLHTASMPLSGSDAWQVKSMAVDSRGYVYAGTGDNGGTPFIRAFSADLQTSYGSVSTTDSSTKTKRFGGLATWDDNGHHYVYATRESSSFYLQRFIADDINNIFLDTTFGSGGTLTLSGGYLHGLAIASDGTIYAAGTNTGVAPGAANGAVYKIAADGSSMISTSVPGAFDLALFGGSLYVSEYGGTAPAAVAVLDAATLAVLDTLDTGFVNTNTGNDSGYSGLDISPQGNIYLADQFHSNNSFADRLLKSSPVPEPATLSLLALCGLPLLVRRRR